eukprot:Blabericola_migrator_1__1938@NODE_1528_length_4336_cov_126_766222_g1004_i0_p1_GENE_NODE_1528_length_4336_cov_126_766222_g1004_i0NODE_1528_length_4336_cov_126_766222_g1004_i0_p1_ORF_typecomplete_len725_score176_96Peptidase_S9/PF00326_21/4_7e25Hydrolase_4/PF12146_8/6_6e03Hydrolase_4/PF12146_8/1e08Abhydrolase_3/PF07859_13/2_9e06DLH/PF01738_18/3_4e06Abhydrolase_1/PF00561_20/1_3e05UPF0227/PF05728_12/0_001Abhydrolase_6/PF12697_7/0_00073PhoPQ_related/PF10142_9/3_9e03PhoPQ_related/PF10142_9/1_6e03PhoPQ_
MTFADFRLNKTPQLPTQIIPVSRDPDNVALEYTYEDPFENMSRRMGVYGDTLVPLESNLVDVYDAYTGTHMCDYKFIPGGGSTPATKCAKLRVLSRDRSTSPTNVIKEIRIPSDLHDPAKIVGNDAFMSPIYHRDTGCVYYIADTVKPTPPETVSDLVKTTLFDYRDTNQTYGERCDYVNPCAFIIDVSRCVAMAVPDLPKELSVKKILPLSSSRLSEGCDLELVIQAIDLRHTRKSGMTFCLNRATSLWYVKVKLIESDKKWKLELINCDLLLKTPTVLFDETNKVDTKICCIVSPMLLQRSSTINVVFCTSDRPGEHNFGLSVVSVQCCPKEIPKLSSHTTLGNGQLLFPRRLELRRCLLTQPVNIYHYPHSLTVLDSQGRLRPETTQPLEPCMLPLTEDPQLDTPGEMMARVSLIKPPSVVVKQRDNTWKECVNTLPVSPFTHLTHRYEIVKDPSGDVIVKSKTLVTPKTVLLYIHGGPNASVAAHDYSPFLACVLESVKVDMCVFPNYRGSSLPDRCNVLGGHIGAMDVEDCVASLERQLGDLEAQVCDLCVIGGSHGGFLTGHLVTHPKLQKILKGGIIWNGVLDLAYNYTTSDIPDWAIYQALGVLDESPCANEGVPKAVHLTPQHIHTLWERSPMSKVKQVNVPICLLVGLKDNRCPPAQSLKYAEALCGVCRLHTYPEDGHALSNPRTSAHRDMMVYNFLTKDLGLPANEGYESLE